MNRVPDRARARREYLRKNALACLSEIVGACLAIFSLPLALVCFMLCVQFPLAGLGLPVFGGTFVYGVFLCLRADQKERSLVYVPPVREQLESLPPDEVLLRGSKAASASPNDLVRPATSQRTAEEALLRASVYTDERD